MNIVILTGRRGHKEDRSWVCTSVDEAYRMVRWLKDNCIDAQNIDQAQWDRLPDREID